MEMSETFKASNGIEVAWKQEGTIPVLQTNAEGCTARVATRPGWEVVGAQRPDSSGVGFGKGSETHKALREFFQHERDQELGRWRWPEYPEYVVHPHPVSSDEVLVRSERGGEERVWRGEERPGNYLHDAARAYFAAHPEPKPWHEAMPGEVWVVRVTDEDLVMTVHESEYGGLRFRRNDRHGTIYALDTPSIREGRRIWPEVPDEA